MIPVLYLTRNGLLEPLGQSQVWPYIRSLSSRYSFTIISFEKRVDILDTMRFRDMKHQCLIHGVTWIPLHFQPNPPYLAPIFGMLQLFLVSLWHCLFISSPKLIHARSYIPALIALLLHRLTSTPFIFDMRALWPEELITAGRIRRNSLLHHFLLLSERFCLRDASAVVSLTNAAFSYLEDLYPAFLAQQHITVIPTCVDLQRFCLHQSGPVTPPVIGCVGTVLSGWFLIDWLSSFFDAVDRAQPTASFELFSLDPPAQIMAALQPSSAWVDRLSIRSAHSSEIPAIIQRHSASVFFYAGGSLSELGRCPTRLSEVLACGRPIVANSGVGDVAELIRDHRIGVLAHDSSPRQMDECVSALFDLLTDPNLAGRCRRTALQKFSLDSGSASYRHIYDQILEHNS